MRKKERKEKGKKVKKRPVRLDLGQGSTRIQKPRQQSHGSRIDKDMKGPEGEEGGYGAADLTI